MRLGASSICAISSSEKPKLRYSSTRGLSAEASISSMRRPSSRVMYILLPGLASSEARPLWSECRCVRKMSARRISTPSSARPAVSASRHSGIRKPVSITRERRSSSMT